MSAWPQLELRQHTDDRVTASKHLPRPLQSGSFSHLGAELAATWATEGAGEGRRRCQLDLTVETGELASTTAALHWHFPDWSIDHHVFLPGGCYAGNRFPARRLPYSPRLEPADVSAEPRHLITDVPRLSAEPGPSHLQLLDRDLAAPAMGWWSPHTHRGWLLLVHAGQTSRPHLLEIVESAERNTADFRLVFPGVRTESVYRGNLQKLGSPDRAPSWKAGFKTGVHFLLAECACDSVREFHAHFLTLCETFYSDQAAPAELPWSAATALIEEHYHRDCWDESAGIFLTDCKPGSPYPYQSGWCGGGIATYPLLLSSQPISRQRAERNLREQLGAGAAPSGFFWGKHWGGQWTSDYAHDQARPHTHRWNLVRRNADVLLYGLKQVDWLDQARSSGKPLTELDHALRRCAESFVRLWARHGQLGQFIDQLTGDIIIGGSTAGAAVPAALARAAKRYDRPEFLETAVAIARHFELHYLDRGVTTGGPGDACQCPDSESAVALLESFTELWNHTRDPRWVAAARAAAMLVSTWIMPYDFVFPPGTEFARLGLRTTGTVFANVQNKHSAPGFCTYAGTGLLRLFRATGEIRWLRLLAQVTRALPQFVSRPDRPIHAPDGRPLPSGWINERVNTSDWDDNPGGVFYGSCWCEVSLLLTAASICRNTRE